MTDGMREALAPLFPFGRWGLPDDAARLVAWLVSEDGRWVTGQVIHSEGGFNALGLCGGVGCVGVVGVLEFRFSTCFLSGWGVGVAGM